MRFQISASALSDYGKLSVAESEQFRAAVVDFNSSAEAFVRTRDPSEWPRRLRVKSVTGAPGVFEMTWSFAGPDGRATWEWVAVPGESGRDRPAIRWRRIGGHGIFRKP